ncbi:hypothetical protein B0H19DRAFT_662291 [Mycena capillaripes]|nr:hypothetical protein B0H19DRAFT_662291 [Mycena capillaripes]
MSGCTLRRDSEMSTLSKHGYKCSMPLEVATALSQPRTRTRSRCGSLGAIQPTKSCPAPFDCNELKLVSIRRSRSGAYKITGACAPTASQVRRIEIGRTRDNSDALTSESTKHAKAVTAELGWL